MNRQISLYSEKLVASANLNTPLCAFRPFVQLQRKLFWKYMSVTFFQLKIPFICPFCCLFLCLLINKLIKGSLNLYSIIIDLFQFTNKNFCEKIRWDDSFSRLCYDLYSKVNLHVLSNLGHKFIFHLLSTIMCIKSDPNDLFISRLANYAENTISL